MRPGLRLVVAASEMQAVEGAPHCLKMPPFAWLGDADAFEAALSCRPKHPIVFNPYWSVGGWILPRDYKMPRIHLNPTDQAWLECSIICKSGGVLERWGLEKWGLTARVEKADVKRNRLLNPLTQQGEAESS